MGKVADEYIYRATRRLFGKARLDRAAELRTHLLERTKQFVLEGFSAEEAEFLAVEQMGPLPNPLKIKRRTVLAAGAAAALVTGGLVGFSYLQKGDFLSSTESPQYALNQTYEAQPYNGEDFAGSIQAVFGGQEASVRLPDTTQTLFFQTVGPDEVSELGAVPATYVTPANAHKAKIASFAFQLEENKNTFELTVQAGPERRMLQANRGELEALGGFILNPDAYLSKARGERPGVPLNRWTPVAVVNARSQMSEDGKNATVLYLLASDAAASETPEPVSPQVADLDEVLKRHQALVYGDVLSYRRLD